MSWGFQPRQVGTEWNPATRDLPRGAWPVCGEADHGLVAGIEAASTVLFDDPLFGLIAFGGEVTQTNASIGVIPRDGVRQRFHAVLGGRRLHLALDRDGFAAEQPIQVSRALDRLAFTLESRAPAPHEATLAIEGLPPGRYSATVGEFTLSFAWKATAPRKFNCHCLPDWGPRFVSNPTQLPTKRFPLLRGPGYFLTALRDTPCAAGDTQAWVE